MLESSTTFRKCTDARHRSVGNEGIVVRQSAGEVLVLNEVGARILDLVAEGASVAGILAVLCAEFDVEGATLKVDVDRFLRELQDAQVIEPA